MSEKWDTKRYYTSNRDDTRRGSETNDRRAGVSEAYESRPYNNNNNNNNNNRANESRPYNNNNNNNRPNERPYNNNNRSNERPSASAAVAAPRPYNNYNNNNNNSRANERPSASAASIRPTGTSVAVKHKATAPMAASASAMRPVESKRCAFAIIHFGKNPIYLELELYFFKMLRQYTKHDIIYLYSVNDTPQSFVDAVIPFVTEAVPYDDKGYTFDVTFKSGYTNFNTLRTCNFIFAYTLDKYDSVCIIESDMVIMRDIDSIFSLRSPAVLTYYIGDRRVKFNDEVRNNPSEVIAKCKDMGRINGGVMLIKPSQKLFETYKSKIHDVIENECKYPNETLFEYVNNSYYNLPIQYNLSHYHAKPYRLQNYGLTPRDINIYHFNETKYKHIDIIKNPLDENGDNWLDIIQKDKKYEVKQLPILHYKNTVYDKYQPEISEIMKGLDKPIPKEKAKSPVSPKKDEIRPISPLHLTMVPKSPSSSKSKSPSSKSKSKSSSKSSSSESKSKSKKPRCPKGTRRNKKTGNCEAYTKQPRCPNGSKRSKKTGSCETL